MKKINWSNGYAKQAPPIKIDYDKYYHYWHMDQILNKVITRGSSVLECGCAPAQWLAYFSKEYNCKVWGIDNSKIGLELSKRNLEMQGIENFGLIEGDVRHIPLPDAVFDVVFSTGLLEHFSTPIKIVKELVRVLKPGGLLIVRIPNFQLGSLLWFINDVLFRHRMSETHFKMDLPDINSWMQRQNLKIIRSEYVGLYVNHGRIPKANWVLLFVNRFTAHSMMVIGKKKEEEV